VQTLLIVDDDVSLAEGLASLLEMPGRRVVMCHDLESAQLVVAADVPDCALTDLRLSGPFGYEGLDFIRDARRQMPTGEIIVMTGVLATGLEQEALRRGANVVLLKPFEIHQLEALLPVVDNGTEAGAILRVPTLHEIIASPLLGTVFQPIVDISREGEPAHGYEALARFRGVFFNDPTLLFEYAARRGNLVDLELACMRRAFAAAAPLTSSARLFLNVHPQAIATQKLAEMVMTAVATTGVAPESVVLEITEQGSLGPSSVVEEQCGALRELGFSFALDDVGMAYSHLAHIEQIRPAYLKISQEFGTDFEVHPARTKIVKNIVSLARDFNCELILEGIESATTREAARDLGLHLCQGYYFARPADASVFAARG
jgi:EAL domain-containing protein (putative c-di-GMP-specific phosphodiesterase class I)/ActR/RegA family two-component response regulator